MAQQVNLTNCDLEPIHIPGRIQSHGFLIVTDRQGIVRFVSANAGQFIDGVYPSLLNQPLASLGEHAASDAIATIVRLFPWQSSIDLEALNPLSIRINQEAFNIILSVSADYLLVEFEPADAALAEATHKAVRYAVPGILQQKSLTDLLEASSLQVKNIIGFDRVMIYRFAADGHGEVIAEAKNDNLEPWLGLHYPASDIPQQARDLYKLNLTRLIADVSADPADLVTTTATPQQLDLTWSQLRAVSPIHIQYLKNMGVATSFSISLLYKGQLWGLIACHNYTTKFINYTAREAAKLIGQIVSSTLEFRQNEEDGQLKEFYKEVIDTLSTQLLESAKIDDALTVYPVNLLKLAATQGVTLLYDKKQVSLGEVPGKEAIATLTDALHAAGLPSVYATDSLATAFPGAADGIGDTIAGILVITLSKELKEYIIWYRPEIAQTVTWAGNPEKMGELTATGLMQISPRHSFEAWAQDVRGKSAPWKAEELQFAAGLREEILNAINVKASTIRAINEKLREAYEELDTFSYTISHDLKTPLTAIKGYAQLLSASGDISADNKKLLLRIGDRADKMHNMIGDILAYSRMGRIAVAFQPINVGNVIDEIIQDLSQGRQPGELEISIGATPSVSGDPVMIWQVFSNLINNAIKYSRHSRPSRVRIEGRETGEQVIYSIKDNGIGIAEKDLDQIFFLFSRMDNVRGIEGTGVGLAIVKKIIERHKGHIWAESELEKGTTFFVTFNKS